MFAALSRIVDNVWYSKERSEVELNRKAGEDIWEVEREIHKGTSIRSARSRQKNEDGSKYVRLCNGRSIINGV